MAQWYILTHTCIAGVLDEDAAFEAFEYVNASSRVHIVYIPTSYAPLEYDRIQESELTQTPISRFILLIFVALFCLYIIFSIIKWVIHINI